MGVSKNGGYHGEAEVDVNHWIWGKIWHCLVGGLKPSEKYESQLGLIFPTEWEKNMFQTTNQNILEYGIVKDSSVLVMI